METDNDKPIAREPWQKLLAGDAGAPPATTDARIRAAARRAVRPRAARWVLPASLAASVVLAVWMVQWQWGGAPQPAVIRESDRLAEPPSAAADEAGEPAPLPERPAMEKRAPAPAAAEAPAAGIPRQDDAPDLASFAAPPPAAAAAGKTEPEKARTASGALRESAAGQRPPEEWYADIQALRAEGRNEEAESELRRLEAAWPGWLERHHPQDH